ncbi:hypothetical protein OHA25_08280 [Nonomuraea sp. NBC_00507]|uniref:hypothetical protein n=1 Tax=Nonomuraea sp. NBC_00507 TaxID=2976002 RepID=UPI002E176CD3
MIGQYRPATEINPGWHIRIQDQDETWTWHEVAMVVETETPAGERRLRFLCKGGREAVALKTDDVMCRTPEEARQAIKEDPGRIS